VGKRVFYSMNRSPNIESSIAILVLARDLSGPRFTCESCSAELAEQGVESIERAAVCICDFG